MRAVTEQPQQFKGSLQRPATSPIAPVAGLWTIRADLGSGTTGSWCKNTAGTQGGNATRLPSTPAWSGSETQKRAHVQSLAQLTQEELAERLFVERQTTTRLKDQLVHSAWLAYVSRDLPGFDGNVHARVCCVQWRGPGQVVPCYWGRLAGLTHGTHSTCIHDHGQLVHLELNGAHKD